MKYYIPAIVIELVGGMLDNYTNLHKIWCFLLGVVTFFALVLIQSIFKTIRIKQDTKDANKIWLDQNNNIVKSK